MTKLSKSPIKELRTSLANHQTVLTDTLLESVGYNDSIKKGLRFFTKEKLDKLEDRYQDGMTWNEIETELTSQGIIFKKSNFRKYLQEKKLSPAIDYKKSSRGREAVYPNDTIRRINYLQYIHQIADSKVLDLLDEILAEKKISAADAIAGQLSGESIPYSVGLYLNGISFPDDDIEQAIGDILSHDPDFCRKIMDGLEKIKDLFDDWNAMLENYKVPASRPAKEG